MTDPSPPPTTPSSRHPLKQPKSRPGAGYSGAVLLGVMIGVVLPLAAFLVVARTGSVSSYGWIGHTVWATVAFSGVLMLAFDRTHRTGIGVLVGFSLLLVVGTGTCIALVG